MKYAVAFARFWYDFIVGDSVTLALGGTLAIAASAAMVASGLPGAAGLALPGVVVAVLAASVMRH